MSGSFLGKLNFDQAMAIEIKQAMITKLYGVCGENLSHNCASIHGIGREWISNCL
jgi:hypothetical protein